MAYTSEVQVREALGLPDWRHLRKEHLLQLLSMMSDMDADVAATVLGQLPDIAAFARAALEDVSKSYDTALASNARSMEMLHEVQMQRLELLRAELGKDVSPEDRLRLLAEVRDVHASAQAKDTENKAFLAEQFDKKLWVAVAGVAALGAAVFAAAKAGVKRPVFSG